MCNAHLIFLIYSYVLNIILTVYQTIKTLLLIIYRYQTKICIPYSYMDYYVVFGYIYPSIHH